MPTGDKRCPGEVVVVARVSVYFRVRVGVRFLDTWLEFWPGSSDLVSSTANPGAHPMIHGMKVTKKFASATNDGQIHQ